MPQFVAITKERSRLYSPVAIQLVDAFSLGPAIGDTELTLETEIQPGVWQVDDATLVQHRNGVFSCPGLGRSANVDLPPRNYRVLVDSEFYESYRPNNAEEFLVHFYNDANPLAAGEYVHGPHKVILQPNSHYPYENHIPIVRGRIIEGDANGSPVESAEIEHQKIRVFSNRIGEFTLPVRFPPHETQTIETTELNEVQVRNARGYFKAVLSIEGIPSLYRVAEILWHSPTTDEATLFLEVESGDDLPRGLAAGQKVLVNAFALQIDTPSFPGFVADVQPQTGFQKFHSIVIPI